MCRASNAEGVLFAHLVWQEDSLGVYFGHQKNDQDGSKPRDARHVYANPVHPEICPILTLSIYLICNPRILEDRAIFPGGSQANHYRDVLSKIFSSEEGKQELASRGLTANDIGTHSNRKGASTFATSGTTAAPSIAAVSLRAGWTMGKVHDTYLRYERAGDQFCGRTVAGLPAMSPDFALLPPFFDAQTEDGKKLISDAVKTCFPYLPPHLARVGEFMLASLVYHETFLADLLPDSHALFQTALFCQKGLREGLRRVVH